MFEHLISSGWHCFGRLWNLQEVGGTFAGRSGSFLVLQALKFKEMEPQGILCQEAVVPTSRLLNIRLCNEAELFIRLWHFRLLCMVICTLSALNCQAVRLTKLECVRGRENSTGEMGSSCQYTQGPWLDGLAFSCFPSLAWCWVGATTGVDLETSLSAPFPVHVLFPACGCGVVIQSIGTMSFLPAAIFPTRMNCVLWHCERK